jgi:hypothetical protein
MKRIENILKIFSSVTHVNGGESEIFLRILNYLIPLYGYLYISKSLTHVRRK